MNARTEEKVASRPSLSILAIISFIVAFLVTRAFTILMPHALLRIGGFHIHHFWYGVALIAIGGWLGISYKGERIGRVAAILFGAGGGIFGDEVGLNLTGNNYWTGITYTFIIIFLTIVLLLALLFRYSKVLTAEFAGLTRSRASVYFSILLAVVSIAVLLRRINVTVTIVSAALALVSIFVIVAYFAQLLLRKKS